MEQPSKIIMQDEEPKTSVSAKWLDEILERPPSFIADELNNSQERFIGAHTILPFQVAVCGMVATQTTLYSYFIIESMMNFDGI